MMALFDEEHRKWQEENARRLRENLQKSIDNPQPGLMGQISHNFCTNLLNSLNKTRK